MGLAGFTGAGSGWMGLKYFMTKQCFVKTDFKGASSLTGWHCIFLVLVQPK